MKRTLAAALFATLSLPAFAAEDGAALYTAQCALCHQGSGGGAPGQYPPLRDRVNRIAATDAGRHYLADLLTNGMAGHITAAGQDYVGYMPSFRQLADAQIAAILNHVISLGSGGPARLTPADIAAARARPLDPAAVMAERGALAAKQTLP